MYSCELSVGLKSAASVIWVSNEKRRNDELSPPGWVALPFATFGEEPPVAPSTWSRQRIPGESRSPLGTWRQQSSPAQFRHDIRVRDIRDNLPTVGGPLDHVAGREREFDQGLRRLLKAPMPLRADKAAGSRGCPRTPATRRSSFQDWYSRRWARPSLHFRTLRHSTRIQGRPSAPDRWSWRKRISQPCRSS